LTTKMGRSEYSQRVPEQIRFAEGERREALQVQSEHLEAEIKSRKEGSTL